MSNTNSTYAGTMQNCGAHSNADGSYPCTGAADSTDLVNNPNTDFLTYQRNGGLDWESPEMVVLNIDGVNRAFYHLIVGNMADGFIQESYVEMGFAMTYGSTAPAFFPNAPISNNMGSASAGDYNVKGSRPITDATNGENPLGPYSISGNGSGNPNRVIMLQLNNDGELFSEFRKDQLLNKPKVYQRLSRFDEINVEFELDMQSLNYNDLTTGGDMIRNNIQLYDPNIPVSPSFLPDAANFDATTESQNQNVTGGKYTYTPGTGLGGSDGGYTYETGSFDQTTIEWETYFDPNDPTGNPWHYEALKPQ